METPKDSEKELTKQTVSAEILENAATKLKNLIGKTPSDLIRINKPSTVDSAKNLVKIISKLSPLLGNMIEFSIVDILNEMKLEVNGKWIRQDPAFPDALFKSDEAVPNPGIEIKAWFPLATEITARFKDSQELLKEGNISVALIAWMPENVIWGNPKIIDVLVIPAKGVAEARDNHYNNPPDYIVLEPGDNANRTSNLQQTNTIGYKFQGDKGDLAIAKKEVKKWKKSTKKYSTEKEYQDLLRKLHNNYSYRVDTNYAKLDRIEHKGINEFKTRVLNSTLHDKSIQTWIDLFTNPGKNKPLENDSEKTAKKKEENLKEANKALEDALQMLISQ